MDCPRAYLMPSAARRSMEGVRYASPRVDAQLAPAKIVRQYEYDVRSLAVLQESSSPVEPACVSEPPPAVILEWKNGRWTVRLEQR